MGERKKVRGGIYAMTYANPQFGLFFASLLGLIIFFMWALKRRRRLSERFADKAVLASVAPTVSGARRRVKAALIVIAVSLAVFSLMRPQWGFKWEEVKRHGLDILIAMDTSKSMLARDIMPNRLERSKLAVKDMIAKLKADRVGLIAFSGSAFLQCPLTLDYSGFMLALDDLDTNTIPRPGTAITAAIREALKVLKGADKKFKVLVLITDGEDHEGDPVKASREAEKEGLRIFCVGVGTRDGEIIPTINEEGQRQFLKDRKGGVVKSRLNEEVLQKIALGTGGAYVRAQGADFGLNSLYDKKISNLEKHELEARMRKNYVERFQIFLAIAALLLFIEPLLGAGK